MIHEDMKGAVVQNKLFFQDAKYTTKHTCLYAIFLSEYSVAKLEVEAGEGSVHRPAGAMVIK